MYKNIEKQKVLQLKDLVEYQAGQVVSRTLVQNDKVSVTISSPLSKEKIVTLTLSFCTNVLLTTCPA